MAARALCVLSFNCRQIELERGGCKRLFCGFLFLLRDIFLLRRPLVDFPLVLISLVWVT